MNKCIKLLDLIAVRCLMSTVNERNFLPEIIFGNGLIRKKHKVLDNVCRNISLIWMNIYWVAFFVHNNLRFWEVKVNGSTLSTLFF